MSKSARAGLAVLVLALAWPLLVRADDWADAREDYTNSAEFAQTKAICAGLKGRRPPSADLPTPAQAAELKGCDSEALYYGEGMRADPVRARLCAFAESAGGEKDGEGFFSGRTILMMLYANGKGVARDLGLATHYACNLDGAPFENDGRVRHLAEMKTRPGAFDVCDDITSGYAEGFCRRRGQTLDDGARQAELDALGRGLLPAAVAPYASLRKAAYAWAEARGGNEVDLSGTARAAMVIDEEEDNRTAFVALVKRILAGAVPVASPARAKAADAALNAAYRAVKARGQHVQEFGTVEFTGVLAAQRAWLRYRDAVIAFAHAQSPGRSTDGVFVALTEARTAQLVELANP